MDDLLGALRGEYHFITPKDTEVLYFYKEGVYHADGEQEVKALLEKRYGSDASSRLVGEIIFHLKSGSYIDRDEINKKTHIPLKNCLLNLDTFEAEEFSPDRIYTFKLPIEFDENADCSNFLAFLNEVFEGVEDTIISIQEQFGYCLYPSMTAQVSFWWYGSGANGKTQLAKILEAFLGKENVGHIDLRTLEHGRFDRGRLYGKLANVIGEPDPRLLDKSTAFKAFTGGDTIYSDVKHKGGMTFEPFAKFFIYANAYPRIDDVTPAFWRRIIAVNFPNRFDGGRAKKEIWRTIATPEELAGILNWAIDGLRRLRENNWEFTITEEMEKMKDDLMKEANPVVAFVQEDCVIDPNATTTVSDLYHAFTDYCGQQGYKTVSKNEFGRVLSQVKGVKNTLMRVDGRRVRGKQGIRLKKEGEGVGWF